MIALKRLFFITVSKWGSVIHYAGSQLGTYQVAGVRQPWGEAGVTRGEWRFGNPRRGLAREGVCTARAPSRNCGKTGARHRRDVRYKPASPRTDGPGTFIRLLMTHSSSRYQIHPFSSILRGWRERRHGSQHRLGGSDAWDQY